MKRYIYLIALMLVLGTGCSKDYFDINSNPNQATDESITPDLILPSAMTSTAAITSTEYDYLGRWLGYWTRGGDYGPTAEEETYKITTSFGTTSWSNWYNNLNDYNTMQKKAAGSGETFYEGIARTMKTVGFMYLVDLYNNVPYSKAFDLAGNIQPTYDKGSDIYADLFRQLDTALNLISADVPGTSLNIATSDIMFHGNATLWKKFINTHRLKLILRETQVPGFDAASEIAKITSDGFLGAGETAAINPGYKQENNKQNPYWNAYDRDYLGEFSDKYNRANNYVLNTLEDAGDIRYQYFFAKAEAPLGGNDYFGYDYGFVDPNPDVPKSPNSSGVYGPGVAVSPSQDQWLLTSFESLFLQAEAIQRGLLPGDAQTAYNAAVTESFVWLGVTDAEATAAEYLSSGNPIVDWAAATDKIKLIITQKYLANVGVDNFETYADYRRLGIPAIPHSQAPGALPNIPLRLRYPQSEYNYNAPNVAEENDPDPQTSGVFWDL